MRSYSVFQHEIGYPQPPKILYLPFPNQKVFGLNPGEFPFFYDSYKYWQYPYGQPHDLVQPNNLSSPSSFDARLCVTRPIGIYNGIFGLVSQCGPMDLTYVDLNKRIS
jgi:hypothetical protein